MELNTQESNNCVTLAFNTLLNNTNTFNKVAYEITNAEAIDILKLGNFVSPSNDYVFRALFINNISKANSMYRSTLNHIIKLLGATNGIILGIGYATKKEKGHFCILTRVNEEYFVINNDQIVRYNKEEAFYNYLDFYIAKPLHIYSYMDSITYHVIPVLDNVDYSRLCKQNSILIT